MQSRARQGSHSEAVTQTSTGMVLLVEDEVLVRMMLAKELRQAGLTVLEAADADEAVDALRHFAGIKCLITDVQMPSSMDGIALARFARSEYPDVSVIFACGNDQRTASVRHDGLFHKPYDLPKFVHHVRSLIGSMSVAQPRMRASSS
jgi:CheY-like chemotaxis protein